MKGYAWASFGPKTNDHLVIGVLSCEECLTEDEKKDLEPVDELIDVELFDDEKYLCQRCGKAIGGDA